MNKEYKLNKSEKLYLKNIIINTRNKHFDKNKYLNKDITTDWCNKEEENNLAVSI